MRTERNPTWWGQEHESAWGRVKAAFKRDWDQTKSDFGGSEPDTDQNVADTVRQAAGKQPIPPRGAPTYEHLEDAYRFGYGARRQYGKSFSAGWDQNLETKLQDDWRQTYMDREWRDYKGAIRRGWDYDDQGRLRQAA
jgi:hypothetical protein